MYPQDVDRESGCRLPLPRREELDDVGQRIYDNLADPKGGTISRLRKKSVGGASSPIRRLLPLRNPLI
jgi:hypothetical protein